MKSEVFFADLSATYKKNLITKINQLLDKAGLADAIRTGDLVAIKLHFGELGNSAFIRPVFLKSMVGLIRDAGGNPFLTDANTLYVGTRGDAPSHIDTAIQNGFAYPVVNAPIIIADGLRGKSDIPISIQQKHFPQVYIGAEIVHADYLLVVSHFTCHELTGFAGALKNTGMGCASRKGKLAQHSTLSPKIKRKRCVGCGDCIPHCSQHAIVLADEKASINAEACIGCSECILRCPNGAIQIQWDKSVPLFMERMVEYAFGVLKNKKDKCMFVNFITDVSPMCDCEPYNDAPIVRDIGILASADPIALDQASVDLVNDEAALPGSGLKINHASGEDKFKGLYPEVEWEHQLDYGVSLGIGIRKYTLTPI